MAGVRCGMRAYMRPSHSRAMGMSANVRQPPRQHAPTRPRPVSVKSYQSVSQPVHTSHAHVFAKPAMRGVAGLNGTGIAPFGSSFQKAQTMSSTRNVAVVDQQCALSLSSCAANGGARATPSGNDDMFPLLLVLDDDDDTVR